MAILEHHVNTLPARLTEKSDLLFPSTIGGYQSPNVLAKPIVEIADVAKISKHLSPYFMRRTFLNLCRAASVHDGLAKVISLAGFRLAQKSSAGGDRDPVDGTSTEPDAAHGGDAKQVGGDQVVIRPKRLDDSGLMINGYRDLRD